MQVCQKFEKTNVLVIKQQLTEKETNQKNVGLQIRDLTNRSNRSPFNLASPAYQLEAIPRASLISLITRQAKTFGEMR